MKHFHFCLFTAVFQRLQKVKGAKVNKLFTVSLLTSLNMKLELPIPLHGGSNQDGREVAVCHTLPIQLRSRSVRGHETHLGPLRGARRLQRRTIFRCGTAGICHGLPRARANATPLRALSATLRKHHGSLPPFLHIRRGSR